MYVCVTLRNAVYFHLHPAGGLAHPVCTHAHNAGEPRPWLAPDMVLAVRSSKPRDSTSAGNDIDREPGTGDGKPGTRDGRSGTTENGKPSTGTASLAPVMVRPASPGTASLASEDGKPGTGDT